MAPNSPDRIKVTHVITSLLMGGAEKVLLRLLQEMDASTFDCKVVALTTVGPLADEFRNSGISIQEIGFNKGKGNIGALIRLCRVLRQQKPDVLQTWLYHGDLLGGVMGRLCTRASVLWNLRQSNLDDEHSTRSTRAIAKLCAKLSRVVPWRIVCGSRAAQLVHEGLNYDKRKTLLIENGFDISKHQHSSALRQVWRQRHGIDDGTVVFGHAGRLDPQKDHETFLNAAATVVKHLPNVKFLMCGTRVSIDTPQLADQIAHLGLSDHVILLGEIADMVGFYSATDLVVMSSAFGEGAPNVLGEAMSCSVACVATDIGDSAHIVGDTGLIVPPRKAQALADAMLALTREAPDIRMQRGALARQRIVEHFPLAKMVKQYEDLYTQAAAGK